MKIKKIISFALGITMGISLLTGCGNNSDKEEVKTTKASDTSEVSFTDNGDHELTVWTWDPAFNIYAMHEAEKIYREKDPQFKLNIEEITYQDIEAKITTAVASGDQSTLPDIFLMQDNSFQKYATNYKDVFLDLNNSGIDFNKFAAAKQKYSVVDGVHYGIPFDNGAVIAGYRTDIIEKAGLKLEDFTDITWSKFIELGKLVKEKTGLPMLTSQTGSNDMIWMLLQSAGASMFNEDGSVNISNNEILKKAFNTYLELYKSGVLEEVTDWNQYIGAIQNGSAVGVINGCWIIGSITAAKDFSGKWGITNLPKLDDVSTATNYSNNGGSSWAITKKSANQRLTIDFMKETFAGSVKLYDTILPSSGALATYLPAKDSKVYKEPQEFFGGQEVYALITEFASKIPSNITGPYWYDARDAVGVALSNVLQKNADIDKELKTAEETVEFNMGG